MKMFLVLAAGVSMTSAQMTTEDKRMELIHRAHDRDHFLPDGVHPAAHPHKKKDWDPHTWKEEMKENKKKFREQLRELEDASEETIEELFSAHEKEKRETAEMYDWWCAQHEGTLGCLRQQMETLQQTYHRHRPPAKGEESEEDGLARLERDKAEWHASRESHKELRTKIRDKMKENKDSREIDEDEYAEMHETFCKLKGKAKLHPCVAWKDGADSFLRGQRGAKHPF